MGHRGWIARIAVLALLCVLVKATNDTSNANASSPIGYDNNPILQYRPAFSRSLPVQILMTGIVLTLVAVLFMHLIFTGQYHWPLAPINYILQLAGVSTLLVSHIATLNVVLGETQAESKQWPFMLSYVAVATPPDADAPSWSFAERAMWLVMNAATSGLIQITHIQFLTLLYPSRLEARLIFLLLAPLAFLAAVMQLLPLVNNDTVVTGANAIRNVCNATLSLLFTLGMIFWGTVVNRKCAWRTDGGTLAFGIASISLAIISTALNFFYIPSDEDYEWLPGLTWAVVLWQSFLGWWWWVGAGMGIGETEEWMKKHELREQKKLARRKRRQERREKAKLMWKGVTDVLGRKQSITEEEVIVEGEGSSDDDRSAATARTGITLNQTPTVSSIHSSERPTPSPWVHARIAQVFQRWITSLQHAHLIAARRQAVERAERITAVYGQNQEEGEVGDVADGVRGWGLGSYGVREVRKSHKRGKSASKMGDGAKVDGVVQGTMLWRGPLRRWRHKDSTIYS